MYFRMRVLPDSTSGKIRTLKISRSGSYVISKWLSSASLKLTMLAGAPGSKLTVPIVDILCNCRTPLSTFGGGKAYSNTCKTMDLICTENVVLLRRVWRFERRCRSYMLFHCALTPWTHLVSSRCVHGVRALVEIRATEASYGFLYVLIIFNIKSYFIRIKIWPNHDASFFFFLK
jgi:hypothetical protein